MSADQFYTGIITDVYAALRGTTFDATRYLQFVQEAGEPALELGCGDDGPFFELVRQGIDIEGVDSSPDMLERARARAADEGLRIVTHCQRMEDLDLPRRYRAIYLAGPTFNLLEDDAAAAGALRAFVRHLEPGGEVLVPLWIPPATPEQEIGQSREAITTDGATARYTVEAENYDERRRTRRTETRYELQHSDRVEEIRRDWIIHWHTPEGFAELASEAGLRVTAISPVEGGEFTARLRPA